MAKKIFLMLAIALMACAMETSAQTRGIIKRTNDGFVALRSEPTVYSTMLRRLHAGDVVYYSSVGDGWSRVKFSPDGYWQGYVASRLILRNAPRQQSYSGERYYGVIKSTNDGFVALRSEPTIYSTMLRRLHAGDEVYYTPVGNGWCRVSFSPNGRWQGYVASRLIR